MCPGRCLVHLGPLRVATPTARQPAAHNARPYGASQHRRPATASPGALGPRPVGCQVQRPRHQHGARSLGTQGLRPLSDSARGLFLASVSAFPRRQGFHLPLWPFSFEGVELNEAGAQRESELETAHKARGSLRVAIYNSTGSRDGDGTWEDAPEKLQASRADTSFKLHLKF